MKRALSNKERRTLGIKSKQAFHIKYKDWDVIVADLPIFLVKNGFYIPTLHNPSVIKLPHVVVDKGAVPFILKGANVLRPGIVKMENFEKDMPVLILYNEIPIAVGIALVSSKEAQYLSKGTIIKTIHYKGDPIWKNFK